MAVRYDEFGGIDVLRVDKVERPVPGDGQVLVWVKAAGINPGEAVIRTGATWHVSPCPGPRLRHDYGKRFIPEIMLGPAAGADWVPGNVRWQVCSMHPASPTDSAGRVNVTPTARHRPRPDRDCAPAGPTRRPCPAVGRRDVHCAMHTRLLTSAAERRRKKEAS